MLFPLLTTDSPPIAAMLLPKDDHLPTYIHERTYRLVWQLVSAQLFLVPSCTRLRFISSSKARWPSGLRRQLKVLLIRWSERAWVQIPLSSLSFCCYITISKSRRKVVEWIKYQLFEKLDMKFVDPCFLCVKPGCINRLGKACAVRELL